jgi:hypothetical protein
MGQAWRNGRDISTKWQSAGGGPGRDAEILSMERLKKRRVATLALESAGFFFAAKTSKGNKT